MNQSRIEKLKREFYKNFETYPEDIFSSPGRIELLGNHTDHNNGKVLVSSVDCNILAVTKKLTNKIIFISEGYRPMIIDLSKGIDELQIRPREYGTSLALIRGVLRKLKDLNYQIGGFLCYCDSTIFKGAGVSSSAAFECLVGKIESYYYNDDKIEPFVLAQVGQYAESIYFNKPCGLLDQSGIALGGINYIDFKDTEKPLIHHLEIELDDYQFILINTGDDHTKLTPCYKAIKDEMHEVAQYFSKNVLREVDENDFYVKGEDIISKTSSRAYLRAKHYFEENHRVDKAFDALLNKDYKTFLQMMNESGESSYYQLQNCYVESEEEKLPQALKFTRKLDKDATIRVHGGGFAGTMLMVIPKSKLDVDLPPLIERFGKNNVMLVSLSKHGTYHEGKI